MQNLVIVESPTKARTLAKFLGSKYQIEASMGHIRDLPKSDIGIDTENFTPRYIVPKDKIKRVNELKKDMLEAKTLWLATDPDREGEAIAWHIKELLKEPAKGRSKKFKAKPTYVTDVKRVIFHEITPEAVKEAFESPRNIDLRLVDAQQARRVLDRLVGYKLSPVLWKKVKSGLSAGRVQSVALRLIVEREKEVQAFKPVEYWSIEAELKSKEINQKSKFVASLIERDGKKLTINDKTEADVHVANLEKSIYSVSKVTKKEVKRYPSPPFTTSTLQQTASNKLGMSAKKTMMVAQNLYEQGLITYMRTDSVNLSQLALDTSREFISRNYGKDYLPLNARVFKTSSKVAQEAHEAIRPTDVRVTGEELRDKGGITRDHVRVYDLIWKRMIASQVSEALIDQTSVDIAASLPPVTYTLRSTGSVIKFDGWLKVYGLKQNDDEEEDEDNEKENILPELTEGENLKLLGLLPQQHFTEPPPRFNEASIIKKLEELGIGRPSTYAPIISTIIDRFYVERREKKFFPTELGITVMTFLLTYFPNIFEYAFTAQMEDALDEVANGERGWKETLKNFYMPFEKKVNEVAESAEKMEVEQEVTDRICPKCGKNLVVKFGRFGKFLACSGFPDCKHTEGLEERIDAKCPDCGGDIVMRRTKSGKPFFGCKNWPSCKYASWTKPK